MAAQPRPAGRTDWAKVAMLGLLAGFAERMLPNLMSGTSRRENAAEAVIDAAKRAKAAAAKS
ncbi:MAG TPA: hypothetical protein VHM01_15410 [Alphaproteobacteria bacterium]|nr:hypothetical protein [Alphaproteobacteria bacterium]